MRLQFPQTDSTPQTLPSDIGSLAFALDEFFDVLDGLYLEGAIAAKPRRVLEPPLHIRLSRRAMAHKLHVNSGECS
jgi:hypothetical protein